LALWAYDRAWQPALPALRHHVKLRHGFAQRLLAQPFPRPADVWIQAASAGEAHLAGMLMERLVADAPLRILASSNTRQGMDILTAAVDRIQTQSLANDLQTHFFPFDQPSIMQRAVNSLKPRIMVLLETELWPGLLYTLRQAGIPVIMINARLRARSLSAYRLWPQLWRYLAPVRTLAISRADAARFGRLFGPGPVAQMPNMKFDRIVLPTTSNLADHVPDWIRWKPPGTPLVILGSIRREEERAAVKIIHYLQRHGPEMIIGLFPRHMHRVKPWEHRLEAAGLRYGRRSRIDGPLATGTVVIGDVFGELAATYRSGDAAFVGGSLARMGGHNFLEPLFGGITPVIGRHWQDFEWVGPELFRHHLVHVAAKWRAVARLLLQVLQRADQKHTIQQRAIRFCERHRGGTAQACQTIRDCLGPRRP
jgi:3-deoxy-D-manno-octulosonic-acid transferase